MNGEYKWKENMACWATYKVLEGDIFLDQFEDEQVPFAQAGGMKISSLRYFLHTTSNSSIRRVLTLEVARKFVTLLGKVYTIRKQNEAVSSAKLIESIAAVFANGNNTLAILAGTVDSLIKFPNEL